MVWSMILIFLTLYYRDGSSSTIPSLLPSVLSADSVISYRRVSTEIFLAEGFRPYSQPPAGPSEGLPPLKVEIGFRVHLPLVYFSPS